MLKNWEKNEGSETERWAVGPGAPAPSRGCPSRGSRYAQPGRDSPGGKGPPLLGVCFAQPLGAVVFQVNNLGGLFRGAGQPGARQVPGHSQARRRGFLGGGL